MAPISYIYRAATFWDTSSRIVWTTVWTRRHSPNMRSYNQAQRPMAAVQKNPKKPAPSKRVSGPYQQKSQTNEFPGIFLPLPLDADMNLDMSEPDRACDFLPHVPWEKGKYREGMERPDYILSYYWVTVRGVLMQGTPKFLFPFQGMFNLLRDFRPWPMKKSPVGL